MVSILEPPRQPESLLSVIIPVHNHAASLDACLRSLSLNGGRGLQVIVIDDGCMDNSASIALAHGAQVLKTAERKGPACARNLGVAHARGETILFLDADVLVLPDTIAKVRDRFSADPQLDALMGSYDDEPAGSGLVSQYRNLLHCFVHRTGKREASIFWSGCGAIRKHIFLDLGGFDTEYDNSSIEDIELGYRLRKKNRKILLDAGIRVKHLKRWELFSMLRTDIQYRGIPWTRLILREGLMPDDLNLRIGQRFSVVLAFLVLALLAASAAELIRHAPAALTASTVGAAGVVWAVLLLVNRRFYKFLAEARGWSFSAAVTPLHFVYFLCNGISFQSGLAAHAWSVAWKRLNAGPQPDSRAALE
jgi:glycosyltransferase involved in cell wall biosynthesis